MIDQIEHFFRTWRRRVSRSEWAIQFLGLPVSKGTATDPGLVLIQIDGLSRSQMERALERGRLPFLRQLIRHDYYETHTFYSGLPSSLLKRSRQNLSMVPGSPSAPTASASISSYEAAPAASCRWLNGAPAASDGIIAEIRTTRSPRRKNRATMTRTTSHPA